MNEKQFNRRAFIGIGAATALATGVGLAGCTTTPSDAGSGAGAAQGGPISGNPSDFTPSFMTPPPVPTDIASTEDCDVLVIGLGLAGCAAIKAATDEGATVIGVDKATELSAVTMAGDFGVVGSQIQKDLGIEWAGKDVIVNQLMKDMCNRPTPDFLNFWYENSGAAFDWFIEGADYEVLPSTAANQSTDKTNYIRPKCFPPLAGYDYRTEYHPYFHGTITTNPNMQWALEAAANAAVAAGADLRFSTWGEQLIVDNGTVTGAYLHDADGNYTQVNAKAVVITTGDFGNNSEMRDYYVPWANEFACYYTTMDANGNPADMGDGQQMAMWAGAHMRSEERRVGKECRSRWSPYH